MPSDQRRALLVAALAAVRIKSHEPELFLVHAVLDSWRGLGLLTAGMRRHGYDLSLTSDESGCCPQGQADPRAAIDGGASGVTMARAGPHPRRARHSGQRPCTLSERSFFARAPLGYDVSRGRERDVRDESASVCLGGAESPSR